VDHQVTASRSELLRAIGEHLEQVSIPRFQMLIIVMVTGLSGFLASVVLLHWGFYAMWLRYGVCVALAYLIFLLLLQLWIYRQDRFAPNMIGVIETRDAPVNVSSETEPKEPAATGWLDWLDFDLPDFDGFVLLAFLAAIAFALVACGYIVYSAPSLFAELLLDGILSAGLYRQMRDLEPRHWLKSVVRRTGVPFAFVAVFFTSAAAVSQTYAPEAVSTAGELRHYSTSPR